MTGAVAATAMMVGLTPGLANAVSSQTYFIGFPDWLPIGEGSTLPSDPLAINNAIVGAKDGNPLIGWGTGGVELRPVFVKWVDGLPQYTVPVIGQTGTHPETYQGTNPLYKPAYDLAYDGAYYIAYNVSCRFKSNRTQCAVDAATSSALNAVKDIPKLIDITIQVPDIGVVEDGYWTTTTAGQWVTPDNVGSLPTVAQLAYAAGVLQSGDMSALAPLLNWTAYFTNVNLIAYGDGAISAGVAYQAFIDSARGATHEGYDPYAVGAPLTGPRKIVLIDPTGKVTLISVDETNNPLDLPEIIYPGSGPTPGFESVQDGGVLDLTVLSLILLRNPGRANGGLYSRFAPIYEALTGVNPVTPDRQDVLPDGVDPQLLTNLLNGDTSSLSINELGDLQAVLESADGKPIIVTLKADIGWQYDLMSDAPATANPLAWANSAASALFLTNLLTGVDFNNLGDGGHIGDDGTIYYTIPVDELPLLTPMRLPAQVLGTLMNLDPNSINTPVADALEPALKALVNIAYTDVVRNEDGTWTRTLDDFDENALFGTQTITRAQSAYLPGDLLAALGYGVGTETTQVLTEAAARLATALKLQLTPEQQQALGRLLAAPGTGITNVAKDAGDGLTHVLRAVESKLPEGPPAPTQAQLGAVQEEVGTVLADARDEPNVVATNAQQSIEQSATNVNTIVDKVNNGPDDTNPKPVTSTTRSKTPVKDAVKKVSSDLKKAGDDLKKAADKVSDTVKKALTPKKKEPAKEPAKESSESASE